MTKKTINAVTSTAKIEYKRAVSGMEEEPWPKLNDRQPKARKLDKETGEVLDEVEVNEGAYVSPFCYKYPISLYDKPLFWEDIENLDPSVRVTKGLYMIKYIPKGNPERKKGRPWKIGQDLIRWDIRVSGPKEWHELCKKIPELGWLERNTTMNDDLFNLTAQQPNMSMWFSVDWSGYAKKLRAARPDIAAPFVSYKCSIKDYKNKYKDKIAMIRHYNQVMKEINEVETMDYIKEEMLKNAGEVYNIEEARLQGYGKDPKTGRFISKKKKED